jgi:hypothetical protein
MGYEATYQNRIGPNLTRAVRDEPPSAVLIDLSRLPSQGRDVALALRLNKITRRIPIVFVDGLPEKVLTVRESLPDAIYSTWTHLAEDLERAFSRPARKAVPALEAAARKATMVPETPVPALSGKALPAKLGIKPNSSVTILGAPTGFEDELEPLPAGVTLRRQLGQDSDVTLWFIRSRRELSQNIALRAQRLGAGHLWLIWPKKASGQSGELSEDVIRDLALVEGLVDIKVAVIDDTWSGLLLSQQGKPGR